jgi:hypothetical protein
MRIARPLKAISYDVAREKQLSADGVADGVLVKKG